jgi:hypothetical protein
MTAIFGLGTSLNNRSKTALETLAERSVCITSTRAARAAGSTDAITATVIRTKAETNIGNAPGILTSRKYLAAKRASTNPNAAPARTPTAAITRPLRSRL